MLVGPTCFGGNTKQTKLKGNNLIKIFLDFLGGNPGYILNKRGFDLVIHPGISDVSPIKEDKMATLSARDVFERNILLHCTGPTPI